MKTISSEMEQALRQEFQYDPVTGMLTRSRKRGVRGQEVKGALDNNGYRTVGFTCASGKQLIKKHRLCYFLHTGEWKVFIAFKDDNKENYKFSNLVGQDKRVMLEDVEDKHEVKPPDYSAIYGNISDWDKARREAEGIG